MTCRLDCTSMDPVHCHFSHCQAPNTVKRELDSVADKAKIRKDSGWDSLPAIETPPASQSIGALFAGDAMTPPPIGLQTVCWLKEVLSKPNFTVFLKFKCPLLFRLFVNY